MNINLYKSNEFNSRINLSNKFEDLVQNEYLSNNEISKSGVISLKNCDMNSRLEVDSDMDGLIDTKKEEEGFEINKNESELSLKNPDVNILIDMDVVNKSAVFIIEMPESWDTKVFNRFKTDETNTRISCINGLPEIDDQSMDRSENISIKENSARLNVEIEMSLCNENLTDSEICANLNSKPVNVKRLSRSDVGDVTCDDYFETDKKFYNQNQSFIHNESPKSEQEVKIERQRFQFESNLTDESNVEEQPKRFDFRYKLPKISFPSFHDKNNSTNDDSELKNEKNDFRSRLPAFELPSICGKGPTSSSNVSNEMCEERELPDSDPNIHSQNNRFDFRYKLPKMRLPSLCANDRDLESETSSEIGSKVKHSNSDPNIHSENNRFDFRYQLPKLKLLSFNEKHTSETDDDIKGKESHPKRYKFPKLEFPNLRNQKKSQSADEEDEIEAGNHPKRFDFRYQLPKIDFPSFSFSKKDSNDNVCADNDLRFSRDVTDANNHRTSIELPELSIHSAHDEQKPPENDDDFYNDVNNSERFDFRYQIPTLSIPRRHSSKIVDHDVPQKSSDHDDNVSTHPERFDFRYQLPKVELPKIPEFDITLFSRKDKSNNVDGDVLVEGNGILDKEIHQDRFDFRYQLPKVELPEFIILRRSSTSRKDDEINIKSKEEDANVDKPPERFDFRYQLPKIEFPEFNILGRSPTIHTEDEIKVETLVDDANIDKPPERFDFRYQLPKIEFPEFNILARSPTIHTEDEIKVETLVDDANIDKPPERFDFRFSLPKIELPGIFSQNKAHMSDDDFYYDINGDPYLSSLVDDFDKDEAAPNYPPPADLTPTSTTPIHISKTPSINLSRKVSNPIARLYLNKLDINRARSPDQSVSDSYSSLGQSLQCDWSKSSDNITPMKRYRLPSVDEQIHSNFSMPVYAEHSFTYGDEHSDIDLYPVPPRFISLPNFSPLVSINVGYIPAATESDVGSVFTGQRKDPYRIDDRFKPLSATLEAEINVDQSHNSYQLPSVYREDHENDSDVQSSITS